MKSIFHTALSIIIVLVMLLPGCEEKEMPTTLVPPVVTFPDTTSHDFLWEITQIGVRHTALYDVEAISDTDVWVCGEIHFKDTYTYDSLGNYIKPYNLGHWNGRDWQYTRLKWPSEVPLELTDIRAIKAFSPDDIWFHAGRKFAHLTNGRYEYWELPYEKGGTQLMEGTLEDMYFAGLNGKLMHFDGGEFTLLNSGTDKNIQDMWTVGNTIMCVCSNSVWGPAYPTLILRIEDGQVTQWEDSNMYKGMTGVWCADTGNVILAGPGLRWYKNGKWSTCSLPNNGFLMAVRALDTNDVFVAGHFGSVQHFNGNTWKYCKNADPDAEMTFRRLSYIKDNVFIIGDDDRGVSFIHHGKRRK